MEEVISIAVSVLETVSQIMVLFSMIRREPGGYIFVGLAAMRPFLGTLRYSKLPPVREY
jgi:hypothetical protein